MQQQQQQQQYQLPNPLLYTAIHTDLRKLTPAKAQKHYQEHGWRENRATTMAQVCPEFRGDIYVRLNPDLVALCGDNEINAQIHWLTKGRFEKRRYVAPAMDKEFIYLYTDEENRVRCKQMAVLLERWQVPYLITSKCPLQKFNLCILFTLENTDSGAYPFYYILNLQNNHQHKTIEKHAFGVLSTMTLQECLVSAGFLDVSVMRKINVTMMTDTVYVMTESGATTNNNNITVSIPKLKHLSNQVSDALTLKYIVTNAKAQNLPFVAVANNEPLSVVSVVVSKVLSFLSIMGSDTWDICIVLNQRHNSNNKDSDLVEVIQLDTDLMLWRTMTSCVKKMKWALCVFNGKIYDNVTKQWDYTRHATIEEFLGTQPLSVLVIDSCVKML